MTIINNQQPEPFARLTSQGGPAPVTSAGDPVSQANLWSQQMLASPYEEAKARVFYAWDDGNSAMGVAGPNGTPSEIVKLRAATGRKAVAFFARRSEAKPKIPPREPNTTNQTFMREQFAVDTAEPEGEGTTFVYTVYGWREYVLRTPLSPDNGDTLMGYENPAIQDDAAPAGISPADLDPAQLPG